MIDDAFTLNRNSRVRIQPLALVAPQHPGNSPAGESAPEPDPTVDESQFERFASPWHRVFELALRRSVTAIEISF